MTVSSVDGNAVERPAHVRVAEKLRHDLMCGKYAPGEVMTLRKLAAQFNVSPMPVRDALRQLVAERALVVINANRSVAVPMPDMQHLLDIIHVRMLLEGSAAERAALNSTPEKIAELEHLLERCDRAGAAGFLSANRDFHFAVYATSGSNVFLPLIESLWLQFGPYLRQVSDLIGPTFRTDISEHHSLIAAIANHDPETARKAVEDDISSVTTVLVNNVEKGKSGKTSENARMGAANATSSFSRGE